MTVVSDSEFRTGLLEIDWLWRTAIVAIDNSYQMVFSMCTINKSNTKKGKLGFLF